MDPQADGESFRLLFVCTGNTCRSPMAAAIARREVEARGWSHVEVRSAGTATGAGMPASGGALRVAGRHGLDLSDHWTSPLTEELVAWADLILTMGAAHLVRAMELGGGEKAALLTSFADASDEDGEGVPDPFGGDDEAYEATFASLEALVQRAILRLGPILAP